MWYIFQLTIIVYVGYKWTTLPNNSPENLGHGLFIGFILAWYATLLVSGLITRIRRIGQKPVIVPPRGLPVVPSTSAKVGHSRKVPVAISDSSNKLEPPD